MVSYRVYFRNFFGVVGQDEFEAPDDGSAYAVAERLSEALSDFCTSFELWQGGRMIATRPVISLAETLRLTAQAIVVEREEAIHNSKSAISQSKRLLERLAEFRAAAASTQPRQAEDP